MIQRFQAFVTGITECHKYIQKIKNVEMTEFGLKGTHVMCLFYLHFYPEGLTAAQLCKLCCEDKAAISRSLALLQERGFIRSGEKKYRACLQLTDAGRQVAGQMDGLIEQWVGLGGSGLTEQERDTFYHVLEMISANLRENVS